MSIVAPLSIQPRLEDHGRGGGIDDAAALVVQLDGDVDDVPERLGEGLRVDRAIATLPSQREREAENDERRAPLAGEGGHREQLAGGLPDVHGADGNREPPVRIRDRHADPRVAEIEPEDRPEDRAARGFEDRVDDRVADVPRVRIRIRTRSRRGRMDRDRHLSWP